MSAWESFAAHPMLPRIGWTLIHFIWQGALIAGALALVLSLTSSRSARARYGAACCAMALMAILPLLTFLLLDVRGEGRIVARGATLGGTADVRGVWDAGDAGTGLFQLKVPPAQPLRSGPLSTSTPINEGQGGRAKRGAVPLFELFLPGIVLGWVAGVLLLSLRLLGDWVRILRLGKKDAAPVDDHRRLALADLARRMGIHRPVRLLDSAMARVPMVVGWLRPMILLPASALSGLSPSQLEAILAHELAHIRRHDYLVNLVQLVIETLLFFHPGVWWVSRRIRTEREYCCDDVAVEISGSPRDYARALTQLEEQRLAAPTMALAAGGGILMNRIRRLMGVGDSRSTRLTRWSAGLVTIAIGLGLFSALVATKPSIAQREEDPEVRRLLLERRDTLLELATITRRHRDLGVAAPAEIDSVELALLQAELDLTGEASARIALYEQYVEKLRNYERMLLAMVNTGVLATREILLPKAARLEAEIALQRARTGG